MAAYDDLQQLVDAIRGCPVPDKRYHALVDWLQGDACAERCELLVSVLDDPACAAADGQTLRNVLQDAVAQRALAYTAIEHLYAAALEQDDEILREWVLGLHHGPASARERVAAELAAEPLEPAPSDLARLGLAELLTGLRALSELNQRIAVLTEWIQRVGSEQVVLVLAAAIHAIGEGQGDARLAIDVFHAALAAEQMDYDLRARLYEDASIQGARAVQRLVLAPPPQAIDRQGRGPRGSQSAVGQPLGMRTWLARRANRDLIDRLLHDPEPSVVGNLLLNPLLTEADVLRIASRRPARPDVLLELSQAPRWNRRYAIRRALVFNPYTPVDLALRQVPFLKRADLRAVAADGKLHPEVRNSAQGLARKRPPKPS